MVGAQMITRQILFEKNGTPKKLDEVRDRIRTFGYSEATCDVIRASERLGKDGQVFKSCAKRILSNFGMTRSGAFKDLAETNVLNNCWELIGERVTTIHDYVLKSGLSRNRYLLELSDPEREHLAAEIWSITKLLLPLTMGKKSWGLVGASKILFSVLPEIVLPVDTGMWLYIFKTVDLGDVIKTMAFEIQDWENAIGKRLNELYPEQILTTLPSVYNVMAMACPARKGE